MNKIKAIVLKDWAEVFRNRFLLLMTAFLPLVFTAIQLFTLFSMRGMGGSSNVASSAGLPPQFAQICANLNSGDCLQYFVVMQFMLLYMLVPMILPMTFAAYSIVGEKKTRTLEPLLATPVTTIELLVGKMLAAALPGVLATWIGFLIYAIGARLLVTSDKVYALLIDPLWLTAIFITGPLLSILSVSIAVMVSSRVNEPRVAEQISGLFVLPITGLLVAQSAGLIIIDHKLILVFTVIVFVLDCVLVFFATRLFQREQILTRWK